MMQNPSLYEKVIERVPNYPIGISRQTRNNDTIAAHWHEHIELLYFTSGECRITCGTESFTVHRGDLIFLNSNDIHFAEQSFTSTFWCIHIRPSFFRDTDLERIRIENFIPNDETVCNLIEQLFQEYREAKIGKDMAVMGYTHLLLTYLLRHYRKNEDGQKLFSEIEAKRQRITPAIQYISVHYTEKISTAELADMLFLSEHYFCKLFKSATGQTVTDYINRVRIEKASILLKSTSESLTEIAMRTGFHDLNYFSRTFERIMQIRPGQYRKMPEHS